MSGYEQFDKHIKKIANKVNGWPVWMREGGRATMGLRRMKRQALMARIDDKRLKEWAEHGDGCEPAVMARELIEQRALTERLRQALEKAEGCLAELYPSRPLEEEHTNEYYAVNRVLNEARAALEAKGEKD